jgi:hypothetical protein
LGDVLFGPIQLSPMHTEPSIVTPTRITAAQTPNRPHRWAGRALYVQKRQSGPPGAGTPKRALGPTPHGGAAHERPLPTHARTLPLYEMGLETGTDIGLRIALDEICAELARQDDAAIVASVDPHVQDGRTYGAASTAEGGEGACGKIPAAVTTRAGGFVAMFRRYQGQPTCLPPRAYTAAVLHRGGTTSPDDSARPSQTHTAHLPAWTTQHPTGCPRPPGEGHAVEL